METNALNKKITLLGVISFEAFKNILPVSWNDLLWSISDMQNYRKTPVRSPCSPTTHLKTYNMEAGVGACLYPLPLLPPPFLGITWTPSREFCMEA